MHFDGFGFQISTFWPILAITVGIWIVKIWIANFYLFLIQMVFYSDAWYNGNRHLNSGPVFKWWSEYRSINQMVIWILNYHGTGPPKSKPFDERINPHDLNTELVCYSDPHCIWNLDIGQCCNSPGSVIAFCLLYSFCFSLRLGYELIKYILHLQELLLNCILPC